MTTVIRITSEIVIIQNNQINSKMRAAYVCLNPEECAILHNSCFFVCVCVCVRNVFLLFVAASSPLKIDPANRLIRMHLLSMYFVCVASPELA